MGRLQLCVWSAGSNGLSDMTLWACNVLLGLGNEVGAYRASMVDEARLNSWIRAGFAKQVFWHQTLEASLCVMYRCLRCFRMPKDNFIVAPHAQGVTQGVSPKNCCAFCGETSERANWGPAFSLCSGGASVVRAWVFGPLCLLQGERRTAPEALILAKNDHKGRRDSRERELSRTVFFCRPEGSNFGGLCGNGGMNGPGRSS